MHLLRKTGALLALALFCLPACAGNVAASAEKLAQAANSLPASQSEEIRRKALAVVLLSEYGRLLPAAPSPQQWETLRQTFLDDPVDESIRRREADALPPADTVSFDGVRLNGGGFARIDQILGTNRLPISFDRRLPTRFVPLKSGEETRLEQAASDFTATSAAESIQKRTDALYRVPLASFTVSNGLFRRPYFGRTDDLFYRLVQENPRPSTELNFYAIVESLPGRHFHPLTGIGAPASVPSAWFSVSEALSGGGLLAVEAFKSRNPRADGRNPFFGFAARLLPFLGSNLNNATPGEELIVSKETIRTAIQSSRRFTPKPVRAIFDDPSRFFSFVAPKFTLVARRLSRSRMAEEIKKIDFATPLPDVPGDPAGNEVLDQPSNLTEGEFLQDLPAALDLDAAKNPEDAALPSSLPQSLPITSAVSIDSPLPASSPASTPAPISAQPSQPEKPEPAHFLAIVTPDVAASEKYLEAIALSDSAFSKNAASLQRVNCYLKWLNAALEPVEAFLQSAPAPKTELQTIAAAVQDQLAALLEERTALQKERGSLLAERAKLRTDLEGAPLQRSLSQLETLLGRPTQVSGSRTSGIIFL